MPFLINIGPDGLNKDNKSGVGSRGYHVFRRERVVVCRWAGITVDANRRIAWRQRPAERHYSHRTIAGAVAFFRYKLREMQLPREAYKVLPRGNRIFAKTRSYSKTASPVTRRTVRAPNALRGVVRAISIRQPLVELILRGKKRWEYRSRATHLRERVYLYASERPFDDDAEWRLVGKRPGELPAGLIVGTVEITDCVEDPYGEYKYKLERPRRLGRYLRAKNQPQPVFWIPQF